MLSNKNDIKMIENKNGGLWLTEESISSIDLLLIKCEYEASNNCHNLLVISTPEYGKMLFHTAWTTPHSTIDIYMFYFEMDLSFIVSNFILKLKSLLLQ